MAVGIAEDHHAASHAGVTDEVTGIEGSDAERSVLATVIPNLSRGYADHACASSRMLTHLRLVDGPPKATGSDMVGNPPPASREHTQNVGRWADFCRAIGRIFNPSEICRDDRYRLNGTPPLFAPRPLWLFCRRLRVIP